MDEVEVIADNDEWELVRELGFFEEILDLLRIVKVTFLADSLHFANLASASGSLNVFEVNLGIFTEVDNRAKVVVEPCINP